MKKKADANMQIGVIVITFITILVGVILFQVVAEQAAIGTGTREANSSKGSPTYTMPTIGLSIDLLGQEYIGDMIITNESGDTIPSNNYTITEIVSTSTGVKTISLTALGGVVSTNEQTVNLTYEYGPDGYIDNSGGRAITGIIAIFFALAVLIVALTPTLRQGFAEMIGR